jgi:LysM repeat protein
MMIRFAPWRAMLLLLAGCLCLSGCFPLLDSGSEEEKNPLITDARAKKAAFNYAGAAESLERALEANPRSSLAHWELGLICYQNVEDYGGAIYHFEKLLKLKPEFKQKDQVRDFINVCKIQLAKTAPLGPNSPQLQREIDKLAARHLELTQENAQLKEKLQTWQLQSQQLQAENTQLKQQARELRTLATVETQRPGTAAAPKPALTLSNAPAGVVSGVPAATQALASARSNPAPVAILPAVMPAPPPAGAVRANGVVAPPKPGPVLPATVSTQAPPVVAPRPNPPQPPSATAPNVVRAKPRTHAVRDRETLSAIARLYGCRVADLMRVNPGLDANRLRAGQSVQLP